jgi:NADH-quinone oxidoreductase subunit G
MSMEVSMVRISVDGKYYDVKPEKNLLETCLSLGIDIPHFCFHPALGSVGACRLCAVKKFRDKDDTKGRIVMSCMEPVAEGLIISVDDQDAKSFRAAVIESLMTNHPHDCPVCDEGGECHLQDMTIMTGHNYRRFDFPKRTYNNQELGPFISHEMNRCIQCYRCVRFYRDYAGGKDLNVFASRNHVYFGRHEDGTLENEFSGNLVEVCPTGVFTDKTLKGHFTRKWDLTNSPSVCVHCSVGCNTIVSERYGSIRRIMSRYNGSVNGYFICDRGRFGYEFVNSDKRLVNVLRRSARDQKFETADEVQLSSFLADSISKNKRIAGIGSPRASLEANYALVSLAGKDNFYHGVSSKQFQITKTISEFFLNSGVINPSLKQIEKADAVLVLGEDLVNTAPMIALALRQSVRGVHEEEAKAKGIPFWNDAPVRELAQDSRSPVFIATPFSDSLDEIAIETFRGSPVSITNLGFAIAGNIDNKVPSSKSYKTDIKQLAEKISQTLKNARNPLIISGTSNADESLIFAALNISNALISAGSEVMLSMVVPECNSMGLSLLPGKPFEDLLVQAESTEIDTLIVLENDLFRHADEDIVNELFKKSRRIIVLDHLLNKTGENADLVMPASTFAESEGTLVSNEGRAQRFYKAKEDKNGIQESWRWLCDFSRIRNGAARWNRLDDIIQTMAEELSVFSALKNYKPDADFRMLNTKIPRQTMRYSGRTAIKANINVSEQRLSQDQDSPLAYTMEGLSENPPSSLVPFYWTPGWNSVQAMYNYLDEPGASMKGGDPGIRLFEQTKGKKVSYFGNGAQGLVQKKDEWLIVPVFQIFGSDELSSEGAAIQQRIKTPFVLMNQNDADILNIKDGENVEAEIGKLKIIAVIRIDNTLVDGIAGISVKLPGMPFIDIPCNAKFHKP